MTTKPDLPDPYVRFYIEGGVEIATMTAADFRSAMLERDHEIARLRAALKEITELDLEGDASVEDAIAIADAALNPPPA